MRKLVFSINVSLDGCADHQVALADGELHDFATRLLETQAAVLFGRLTYQLFEGYWPHAGDDPGATQAELDFAATINAKPKFVFSNTLVQAAWEHTTVVRGDALEAIRGLKAQDGGDLALGGIRMIQACLQAGLVDEFWLLVQPRLWGTGRRLFAAGAGLQAYRLVDLATFGSGVAVLHYSVPDSPPRA